MTRKYDSPRGRTQRQAKLAALGQLDQGAAELVGLREVEQKTRYTRHHQLAVAADIACDHCQPACHGLEYRVRHSFVERWVDKAGGAPVHRGHLFLPAPPMPNHLRGKAK